MKKNPISITIESFLRVADIAVGAKVRRESDTEEFMEFYRNLVETLPLEACKVFGNLPGVVVTRDDKEESGGLELSVTDYLWWKAKTDRGATFNIGSRRLKNRMIHRLAEQAEKGGLNPQERQTLLNLLDPKSTTEETV